MTDAESVRNADEMFATLRPTVDVGFEDVAVTCSKVIEKANQSETLTDADRDAVRRAHFAMRFVDQCPDDVEKASIDKELWEQVTKDAEGVDVGIAPPSVKIESLAKSWNAEPAEPTPADPPAEPPADPAAEPPSETPADVAKIYGMGNINDMLDDDDQG